MLLLGGAGRSSLASHFEPQRMLFGTVQSPLNPRPPFAVSLAFLFNFQHRANRGFCRNNDVVAAGLGFRTRLTELAVASGVVSEQTCAICNRREATGLTRTLLRAVRRSIELGIPPLAYLDPGSCIARQNWWLHPKNPNCAIQVENSCGSCCAMSGLVDGDDSAFRRASRRRSRCRRAKSCVWINGWRSAC